MDTCRKSSCRWSLRQHEIARPILRRPHLHLLDGQVHRMRYITGCSLRPLSVASKATGLEQLNALGLHLLSCQHPRQHA